MSRRGFCNPQQRQLTGVRRVGLALLAVLVLAGCSGAGLSYPQEACDTADGPGLASLALSRDGGADTRLGVVAGVCGYRTDYLTSPAGVRSWTGTVFVERDAAAVDKAVRVTVAAAYRWVPEEGFSRLFGSHGEVGEAHSGFQTVVITAGASRADIELPAMGLDWTLEKIKLYVEVLGGKRYVWDIEI